MSLILCFEACWLLKHPVVMWDLKPETVERHCSNVSGKESGQGLPFLFDISEPSSCQKSSVSSFTVPNGCPRKLSLPHPNMGEVGLSGTTERKTVLTQCSW
jgi:hypothetical protein